MSNEPPLDAADAALLEQAVRALRDDLPDDARMRRLEGLVAPAPAAPWWQRGRPRAVAGAVLVLAVGTTMMMARGGGEPPSPSRAAAPPAPATTSTLDPQPASLPAPAATPQVSVDALPAAPPARSTAPAPTPLTRDDKGPRERSAAHTESAGDQGDELSLLEEARGALAADPTRALALADAHARRFAKPALAQERERLAIDALVRLGRHPEAEARARAFEATYPQSAHLARVRALVAPRVEP